MVTLKNVLTCRVLLPGRTTAPARCTQGLRCELRLSPIGLSALLRTCACRKLSYVQIRGYARAAISSFCTSVIRFVQTAAGLAGANTERSGLDKADSDHAGNGYFAGRALLTMLLPYPSHKRRLRR